MHNPYESNGTSDRGETLSATHTNHSLNMWKRVDRIRKRGKVVLNGSELDIASVIAVAKYNCDAQVDMASGAPEAVTKSVTVLEKYLSEGYFVYGVNTGFGGSADSRTSDLISLQSALLQLTQAGILSDADKDIMTPTPDVGFQSMPVAWVRATMLIRCNNALRGQSGVRLQLIEAILHLLRGRMTPIVPLRGSISASGDLMPLAYIAGTLEGNPDIMVRVDSGHGSKVVTAHEALTSSGLQPYVLGPKEGLGLINGTATSAAVACFAVHESNKLALLSQMLVAMSCEALLGNSESFHPFFARVRPHPGQLESSSNILRFLHGSSLAQAIDGQDRFKPGLFQDRYALRGAPQWIGPQLEDLTSVFSQLTIELNSTTDNPLIDTENGGVYSGGNFIAASLSSGMEKSRLSLQMIGKLLFSLSSELINPALSRGLPPNLAADEPSTSFTMKGIDISMAAYMSELAFLANPVTSHVQSAESHNQSINSLALISARYTIQAAEIVAQMCAAHLYVVCQALDLRVFHVSYLKSLRNLLRPMIKDILPSLDSVDEERFQEDLYETVSSFWDSSSSLDLKERCIRLAAATLPVVIKHYRGHYLPIELVREFQQRFEETALSTFLMERDQFFEKQTTPSYLGSASKILYSFVREDLGVPFHQGLIDHPTRAASEHVHRRPKRIIGSWVSLIFAAIRDDHIWKPIAHLMDVAEHMP